MQSTDTKKNNCRLDSALASSGAASRRKSAELIRQGFVSVNGRVFREPGKRINPQIDRVICRGKKLVFDKSYVYAVLHKPKGYLTTCSDTHGRKTVMDLVRIPGHRVYPVGRLDKDSEGLLLFTDDGECAYRAMHPSFGVVKKYIVWTEKPLTHTQIKKMSRGIMLDGRKTSPALIKENVSKKSQNTYTIQIHEGRNRQIRRMLKACGSVALRLRRESFGNITLGRLRPGTWKKLTNKQIKDLLSLLGIGQKVIK